MGAASHVENPKCADIADDAALDQRVLDLDICAHQTMFANFEALAVENVAVELTIDPQGARHHDRSTQARAHAHDRVWRRIFGLLWPRSELHHHLRSFAGKAGEHRCSLPEHLEHSPGFEQALQVLLAIELELDLPPLASLGDHDLGAEALLE